MKVHADFLKSPNAGKLFDAFSTHGFQLWYVGGCVRNAILGGAAADLDMATDATPDDMRTIANANQIKIVPTGEDHGTMTFVLDSTPFEVTTFRKDVETDGRRAVVAFSKDLADDARRRDFTMNALYMDRDGLLQDPVGGYPDVVQRHVRFIDDPSQRIREDHLRILRFFRFFAWYGAPSEGIDANGLAACASHAQDLTEISQERITAEVLKLLTAPNPSQAVAAMDQCGVLSVILPGATSKYLPIFVDAFTQEPVDPLHRLAVLTPSVPKGFLRLSNADHRRLAALVEFSRTCGNGFKMGHDLGLADGLAALHIRAALLETQVAVADLDAVAHGADATFPMKAEHVQSHFSGPALGAALKQAKAHWLDHHGRPSREDLIQFVQDHG